MSDDVGIGELGLGNFGAVGAAFFARRVFGAGFFVFGCRARSVDKTFVFAEHFGCFAGVVQKCFALKARRSLTADRAIFAVAVSFARGLDNVGFCDAVASGAFGTI